MGAPAVIYLYLLIAEGVVLLRQGIPLTVPIRATPSISPCPASIRLGLPLPGCSLGSSAVIHPLKYTNTVGINSDPTTDISKT